MTEWLRPALELSSGAAAAEEILKAPKARAERLWVLFVGEHGAILESAARHFIDWKLPVISPPASPPLPLAVEELPAPSISGERVLYAPSIERGFFDTPLSAASPLYLLPRLTQLASEGAPLTFVATAIESDLLHQGGKRSRPARPREPLRDSPRQRRARSEPRARSFVGGPRARGDIERRDGARAGVPLDARCRA